MSNNGLAWAIPVMRIGYAGRGLVYFVVALFSLYAIWHGGQAKGTSSALSQLETTVGGSIILFLIFVGMVAFAIWRLVDALYDLDEFGTDAKGLIARMNMIVTGFTHLAIGALAFSLLFIGNQGGGDGSIIADAVRTILGLPGGRPIVALFGLIVMGAGTYHLYKGWSGKYRDNMRANHFTMRWNWVLKAGVIAKGAIVFIIGLLFIYAAIRANPEEAGGVGKAFSWLTGQPYGWALVAMICVGLLGYASYCFINAAYRIVPKVDGHDIETLAVRVGSQVRAVF